MFILDFWKRQKRETIGGLGSDNFKLGSVGYFFVVWHDGFPSFSNCKVRVLFRCTIKRWLVFRCFKDEVIGMHPSVTGAKPWW